MEIASKEQQKINYKQKNYEFIEKIKQKKLKQAQQKANLQKKQQLRRDKLKRKILQQARVNRQNKRNLGGNQQEIQGYDSQITPGKRQSKRQYGYGQSLPKRINPAQTVGPSSSHSINDENKKNYKQRYLTFLQNLHDNNKSKKQIQEHQKKKRQQQYVKIKQELGMNKIQSKIGAFFKKKDSDNLQKFARSHSAQKFEELCNDERNQQNIDQQARTHERLKKKNDQYIEKIKKRRMQVQKQKQEQQSKKQKLKQKLKDFVMNTVKKNVLDGVYDDQVIDRNERKKKKNTSHKDRQLKQQKDQDQEKSSSSEQSQQQSNCTQKKKRKMRSFPNVTDLNQWKKKNRLQVDQKVFIVTGGYPQLKKALKQRGWVQNPDYNSPCFNMKYTLQGRQIDYNNLKEFQLVNHYSKNGCITTKVGLTKSLRNLIWINDTSEDNFFPKCFDLNDQDDYVGFQMHFKLCKAISILKIYASYASQRKYNKTENQIKNTKQLKGIIQDLKLRTQVALSVCKKNIEDINDIIDKKKTPQVVTDKQWQILSQDQLNEQSLAKKKHQQWLKSIDVKYNSIGTRYTKKQNQKSQKPKKKKIKKKQNGQKDQQNKWQQEQQEQQEVQDILFNEVSQLLQIYQSKYPQFHLTGHNNIWILKPAGLSRGRGITCYNNLVQIQDHVKCKQSQWIAQKYIQNPIVILRRKFDIRQWVLVTDFNPLTIWNYQQFYIRFSAVDYDPKQVSNKFIHLTNNSIGSHYKQVKKSHIKGNMFFQSQFSDYLRQLQGYDVFQQKIKPQIKDIVKYSLMCAVQNIQNRKGTHQLFGYDLMVDTNYKVWLIQINSSPSMDYSTHVTTKLVKECLQDIIKVVVDYQSAPKKQRKSIDTGKFKKIYKGIQIPEKPITSGLNLCLQGTAMKKTKKNVVRVQTFSLDNKSKN